jgi:hypothetical protein
MTELEVSSALGGIDTKLCHARNRGTPAAVCCIHLVDTKVGIEITSEIAGEVTVRMNYETIT